MNFRILSTIVLLCFSGLAWPGQPNPADLLQQARKVVAKNGDYNKAIGLLQKANAIWQKNGAATPNATPPEYAESLTFLASLYLAQDRRKGLENGIGKDNDFIYSQWKTQSSELLSGAVRLSRAASPSQPENLALALELQSLMMRNDDGGRAWKQASEIRSQRVSEILPPSDLPPEADATKEAGAGSSNLQSPTLLKKVEPTYSVEARTLQMSGVVHLFVTVEPNGTPSGAQLKEGLGFGLDEQAAKAVKEWRFNPGTKDGQNVRVRARVDVAFKLL